MKDPIAIIGLGCRFPRGGNNPRQFWDLICNKYDAITEVPEDRWALDAFYNEDMSVPGTIRTKCAGFIDDFDKFDADFFSISPREANALDPQQRQLLQVTWETLEDAGVVPEKLQGSRTGVYVGCFAVDYNLLSHDTMQRDLLGAHTSIGSSATLLSNRVSHFFDFKGPSLTVDTACSSSMVALHLAVSALEKDEIDQAIVGGVNMIFKPEWTISTSKGGFLSPDGRCKVFDASANGYVRSEGIGAFMLKPLSAAKADNNRVYAVIRATGSNQDGHTKSVTIPSRESQSTLMGEVYQRAGINPIDVAYVEAHGTGTPTGDPIETGAIADIFAKTRSKASPLKVGSVKSNVGHLEAASGMAGLMKAVLSLHFEQIPPNIHFNTPNPNIPFADWNMQVVCEKEAFKSKNQPRYVGVNSFGFGGSNVHVCLEGAESYVSPATSPKDESKALPVVVSARSPQALKANAARLADHLEKTDDAFNNLSATLALHRQSHPYRAAFVSDCSESLKDQLGAFVEKVESEGTDHLKAIPANTGKTAFVFSGMGPQWWAMGRQLMKEELVFRDKIKEIDHLLSQHADWSLWDELNSEEATSRIEETRIAQPGIFAVQVALSALLTSWGIKPDGVIGHSAGEVAATHISGALSLEEACLVIYHRSRLQHQTEGQGRILAIGLPAQKAETYLQGREKDIALGAVNSPSACALAGDETVLNEIVEDLRSQKIFCKMLNGKVPYHSPKMDPLKDELLTSLVALDPKETTTTLYSTVTGGLCEGGKINAGYWFENVRNTVLFQNAIEEMLADGYDTFIEFSPNPVLASSIEECARIQNTDICTVTTLRRGADDHASLYKALGTLWEQNRFDNWSAIFDQDTPLANAPLYAWQLERYWLESDISQDYRKGKALSHAIGGPDVHPLLGARIESATPLWACTITPIKHAYLFDHKVINDGVYPGAAYIECALSALDQLQPNNKQPIRLSDIHFQKAFYLSETEKSTVQITFDEQTSRFNIFAKTADHPWQHHAKGKAVVLTQSVGSEKLDILTLKKGLSNPVEKETLYKDFAERGLFYGPAFQGISELTRGKDAALSRLTLASTLDSEDYQLHPSLLDAAFQTFLAILDIKTHGGLYLPTHLDELYLFNKAPDELWCYCTLDNEKDGEISGTITLCDQDGHVFVRLNGFTCKALSTQKQTPLQIFKTDLYQFEWLAHDLPQPKESSVNTWLLMQNGTDKSVANHLYQELSKTGAEVHLIDNIAGLEAVGNTLPPSWGVILCQSNMATLNRAAIETSLSENEIALLDILHTCTENKTIPKRICLITQGLRRHNPLAASLWGMGRVVANEYPNITCKLVDIASHTDLAQALPLLYDDTLGMECALDHGQSFIHRLKERTPDDLPVKSSNDEKLLDAFCVINDAKGYHTLSSPRRLPDTQEIEIRLKGLAPITPDLKYASVYGQVMRTGKDVSNIKIGEEVIALSTQGVHSFLTLSSTQVLKAPQGNEAAQYAKSMFPHLLGKHTLNRVGSLKAGDSILVYDDAWGIGQALVQLAQIKKLKAIVLCENTFDPALWQSRGADYVLDGNQTDLSKELGAHDIALCVFSSANNDRAQALLSLPAFASFVDCKLDNAEMEEEEWQIIARNNLVYHALKADIFAQNIKSPHLPDLVSEDASSCLDLQILLANKVPHEGNQLIAFNGYQAPLNEADSTFHARPDANYLITGGVRGFGLSVAKWLVQQGARHLVLVGRSNTLSPEAEHEIEQFRTQGVTVQTCACDISDAAQVKDLLTPLKHSTIPLAGIFHAANVYGDAYLSQLSEGNFRKAFYPKALGAWHLHEHTQDINLDCLVLFSSISSVIGNPGQSSYVAANSFLSALAQYRRESGLPALSIDWGAIADVGYLAQNSDVEDQLQQSGLTPLSPSLSLEAMGALINRDIAAITLAKIDWSVWQKTAAKTTHSLFNDLVKEDTNKQQTTEKTSKYLTELKQATSENRETVLQDQLISQVSLILGLSSAKRPTVQQGFADLGMDSMLSVEFRNRLQTQYACTLPATLVFLYPDAQKLADYLLGEILADHFDDQNAASNEDDLEDISLDEIAALLEETLARDAS